VAPLPPIANVIKVTLTYTVGEDVNVENILHFKYTGGPPVAADCVTLSGAFATAFSSDLKSLLSSSYALEQVTTLDLNSDTGAEGSYIEAVTGTRSGSLLPANCTVVVSHQIARRYRGGHPRNYLPFLVQGDLANPQQWAPSPASAVASGWNAFIAGCLTATAGSTVVSQYGSVSYYLDKALRTTPAWDPILGTGAKVRVGSQRRRLGKST
jgi:hypothetical protein